MTDPIEQAFAYLDIGHPTVKAALTEIARLRAIESRALAERKPTLAVCYGPMPESNGKSNWTAILHNGDISSGITLDRSEYPDRVRYEADRARWLIGELDEKPFILDYDADKHSGYVSGHPTPDDASQWISVDDRLPDEGQAVMFVVASKYPDYNGRVFGGSFCMLGGRPSFNTPGVGYFASHWMPTPKPPAAIDAAMQADKESGDE